MESSSKKRKLEEVTVDKTPKMLEPFTHEELMHIARDGASKQVEDAPVSYLGSLAISVLRNNPNPSRMQVPTLTPLTTVAYADLVPDAEENSTEGYGGQPSTSIPSQSDVFGKGFHHQQ